MTVFLLTLISQFFNVWSTEEQIPHDTHWLGYLTIKPVTYRIYLRYSPPMSALYVLNPKANQIPLDTLFTTGDSLIFSRADFFSTFKGQYLQRSNTIEGYWTDDAHKKHKVAFKPVIPDTLTGLRPLTSPYAWRKPSNDDDNLATGDPREENIDSALLDELSNQIAAERFPNIQSLLIARNGKLVYEQYFYGFDKDRLWLIQSATKSFTSALTGISLGRGEIKSVHDPLCRYLPEYKTEICDPADKDITIQQLLTMSTGLEWNELSYDYADEQNRFTGCDAIPDPMRCLLSRSRQSPTISFAYNSANHMVMNKILRRATGLRNRKELNDRLLRPLGITSVNTWQENFGVIGDISLTPRSMMKFGLLYLADGRWNNEQLIPADWIEESTSKKIDVGPGEGYGYFWWTKDFAVGHGTIATYYAWGYAGQYIFVVPDLELVVVMTASNWIMDEKKYAFEMMGRYILPACE